MPVKMKFGGGGVYSAGYATIVLLPIVYIGARGKVSSEGGGRGALLQSIAAGKKLKKVEVKEVLIFIISNYLLKYLYWCFSLIRW